LSQIIQNSLRPRRSASVFFLNGISKAGFLEQEARLEKWLANNQNGQMSYMENHFDKRLDPTLLVEDAKM
jgi:epoxyqueuosine reductase